MKSFKILIAALALSAVFFAGCAQKEVITGIDSSKAGITDFEYDETMSSATSVSLVWNPNAALEAGASSISVQLAHQADFSDATMYTPSVSMYSDTPQGITIQKDAAVKDGAIFSGLKEYDRFYARVRANYPRSIYSEWTVLSTASGDQALISVGHGIISMAFAAPEALKLESPAYSRIVASWSLVGPADGYTVEWKKSSDSSWTSLGDVKVTNAEIGDLEATTSYDVRVKAFRTVDGAREETSWTSASVTTAEKPAFTPQIETKDQLVTFLTSIAATASAADSYTLEKDVDLEGESLQPIESFAGKFDGKGHTIKNASVSGSLFNAVSGSIENVSFSGISLQNGLVGVASESSKLAGITLAKDCKFTIAEPTDAANFGALVNTSAGAVENCKSEVDIELVFGKTPDADCNFGGLVGYTSGTVTACSHSGKFTIAVAEPTAKRYHTFGGVVGMYEGTAGKSVVVNCSNTGEVSVEYGTAVYFYTGGVIGGTPQAKDTPGNYGVIEGCTNEGDVSMHYINGGSGAYPNIGGVVGYTEGAIKGSTNKGNITILCDSASATWTCARVAGVGGTVTQGASDCHNYGKLSATALFAGGTAGARGAGNIATCCLGGVIGSAGPYTSDGSVVFEKCSNNADLDITLNTKTETPNHHFGGVFGYVTGKIADCENSGNITMNSPTCINRVGGIAGGAMYEVSGCTNKGNIKANHTGTVKDSWVWYVGGIVADAHTAGDVAYTKCNNSGDLSFETATTLATSRVSCLGGIVGASQKDKLNITFTDCTSTGKISYTSPATVNTGDLCGGNYYTN